MPRFSKRKFKVQLFLAVGGLVLIGFNNCGVVDQPTATGFMAQSSFSHDGITQGCAACHDTGKSFARFPASGHQATNGQDCSVCHSTSSWIMANPHGPGAATPTSCIACHASKVPSGYQGSVSLAGNLTPSGGLFDHSGNGGTGDCVTCHLAVPANIGITWVGGVYDHTPTPTSCQGCHTSAQRPTGSAGTPPFNHDTGTGGTGDCVNCHSGTVANIGRTWAQAAFTHSPTPAACASCHLSDANFLAVQNIIKYQMSHTVAGLPDCVNCHSSAALSSGWTAWAAESVANGTSTARASLGIFHTGFGSTPTTCQNCHTNERPTTIVGSPSFDHSSYGSGDCVSCHASVPANIGKTWAGGAFYNHSPTPTTCASCHTTDPQYTAIQTSTWNQMNHSMAGLPDCAKCHSSAASASTWSSWVTETNSNGVSTARASLGIFHTNFGSTPSTCQNCHAAERPSANVGSPSFSHTSSGTGDCVSCHTVVAGNIGKTWAAGNYSHSPAPATCNSCHATDTVYTAIKSAITKQMNHSFAGLPDCATCHSSSAASANWANWVAESVSNGTYTARVSKGVAHTNFSSTPATCSTCHSNEVPAGTYPNTTDGFTHAAGFGTECSTCHTQVAANIGLKWANGFFGHAGNSVAGLGNTCLPCHQHHNTSTPPCTRCHTVGTYVVWPTASSTGTYGGAWGRP